MSIVLLGSTSGSCTLQEQAVAGNTTLTLPTFNGTVGLLVSGTSVASTSGTSIDFTGLPSGVRRITVMFSGVSTNGTSNYLIQLGDSGGVETTGYLSGVSNYVAYQSFTTGFGVMRNNGASSVWAGSIVLTLVTGNSWVSNGNLDDSSAGAQIMSSAGSETLSDTLDRVRITTVNGTDTFDAGSVNILYE